MEGLHNIEDLRNLLFRVFQTKSQKEVAKKLGISGSTLSRIFSNKREYKNGPKTENTDKIVNALDGYYEMGRREIKELVYGIIYGEKKQEYLEKSDAAKGQIVKEKPEADFEVTVNDVKLEEENFLNGDGEDIQPEPGDSPGDKKAQMEEIIKKAAEEMMLAIGYDMEPKSLDWGNYAVVLYEMKRQRRIPYTGHRVEMVLAIGLAEEIYTEIIHRVVNLDEEDGIVVLYCEQTNILDKAWKDDSLKVSNNVLLYDLSKKAKWYVKSARKGEKKFLEFLFGKDNLIFPRK